MYLHVLKGSESNESKKKNLYFFGRKLWSGLEPPPAPNGPDHPKVQVFFFDAAPNRPYLIFRLIFMLTISLLPPEFYGKSAEMSSCFNE